MSGLMAALLAGTFATGLALLGTRGHARLTSALSVVSSLSLATLSLLLLSQTWGGAGGAVVCIPQTEGVALVLRPPGVYLAITAFWALALAQISRPGRFSLERGARCWPALAHLFCGLVVLALTVDQFLVRYVLLELVALSTIVAFALDTPARRHDLALWRCYLQFRLGDIGLILAVLLLNRATGTFLIDEMLTRATHLPPGEQIPILLGGLLAVWVKMGLPPFHGWLADGSLLPWQARVWVVGAALPLLGAYLLYRLRPLFFALGAFRLLTVAGVGVLAWVFARLRRSGLRPDASPWWFIGHGAVGLILAGTQAMNAYLLTFLPVRVALCALAGRAPKRDARATARDGSAPTPTLDVWLGAVLRLAQNQEPDFLEAANRWLAEGIRTLSRLSASIFEGQILEGLNRGAARVARTTGRTLQDVHVGRLRRNLLWASLALIALATVSVATLAR